MHSVHYIIKDELNNTYYTGNNIDKQITEEHFSHHIYNAMDLDSVEEALEYINNCHIMGYLRILEIFRTY